MVIKVEKKYCKDCGVELIIGENWASHDKKNHQYRCRKCKNEFNKRYIGREYKRKASKDYRRRIRLEVLTHYGGNPPKCACCGEAHIEFLTIDHIDGNGNKHRRQLKEKFGYRISGWRFYCWLKSNNFPEGYRVLCMNCNHSLAHYKYCTHKKVK